MGKRLGVKLVAEYVETEVIQEIIKSVGIDYSQGYIFSVPKPIEELSIK